MNKKYEEACRQEGLSEEQTRRIRQIFNTDYVRMRREQEYREKNGIVFNSLSALGGDEDGSGDFGEYDIPDESGDPLEKLIHSEEQAEHEKALAVLKEVLAKLDPENANILMRYYSGGYGIDSQLARELGMERKAFIRRRERLLKDVREKFFEKWNMH